jgi:AcrR family transcriptional regulator
MAAVPDPRGVTAGRRVVPGSPYQKLRPGPGLPAERVIANQRARLCSAMIELAAGLGYQGVTVRRLSGVAGVSTRTFYECFASVEECFVATQARIIRDLLPPAPKTDDGGDARIRERIHALFSGLGTDPKASKLVLVESFSAGPAAVTRMRGMGRALERLIVDEFAAGAPSVGIQPAQAHGIVDAALRVARTRLLAGRDEVPAVADRFADWLLALKDPRLRRFCARTEAELRSPAVSSPRCRAGDDRSLLLAAAGSLGARDGYANLTVAAIRRKAGVSRRSFEQNFDGAEDCFLAAVQSRLTFAARRAERSAAGAGSWERGVVRVIGSLGSELAKDPALARLGLIEILAPGRAGLELREEAITEWARRLLCTAPARLRLDPLPTEASLAAAWGVAEADVAAGHNSWVRAQVPSMALMVLAPVVGAAATERAIFAELTGHGWDVSQKRT